MLDVFYIFADYELGLHAAKRGRQSESALLTHVLLSVLVELAAFLRDLKIPYSLYGTSIAETSFAANDMGFLKSILSPRSSMDSTGLAMSPRSPSFNEMR